MTVANSPLNVYYETFALESVYFIDLYIYLFTSYLIVILE